MTSRRAVPVGLAVGLTVGLLLLAALFLWLALPGGGPSTAPQPLTGAPGPQRMDADYRQPRGAGEAEGASADAPTIAAEETPERQSEDEPEDAEPVNRAPDAPSEQRGEANEPTPVPAEETSETKPLGGVVLDEHDRPVEGAVISFKSYDSQAKGIETVTSDASGRFTSEALPVGRYVLHVAPPTGDSAYRGSRSNLVPAGRDDVALSVWRGACLGGVVVDEAGEPLVGVRVRVRATFGGANGRAPRRSRHHSVTDADGRFLARKIKPEATCTAVVEASAIEGRDLPDVSWPGPGDAGVPAGTSDVRIVVTAGDFIAGRVIDQEGQPVVGVIVVATGAGDASPGRDTADADGRFRIEGLSRGRHTMSLAWLPESRRLLVLARTPPTPAGTAELILFTTQGEGLFGTVTDAAELPLKDVTVKALDTPGGPWEAEFYNARQYQLMGFEGGERVTLVASAPGYVRQIRRDVVVPGGATFRLVRGYSAKGRLVDQARKPVTLANLRILDENGDVLAEATTDLRGLFTFRDLPAREHEVLLVYAAGTATRVCGRVIARE